ncbi:MAG: heparan-alpha-glucosaminide N-acetyltransferase domain-containing protein [Candidatus Gracilibacteria bacterium]|nr:heparan-alpha-glucosaminide N-acetyltransferase domain-containing protein [Candidatus Gracilibacteria bacterium]
MRYEKIDYLKGFLVIVMILFHFNYILSNVFGIYFDISPFFLKNVQLIGGSLFIGISGFCFAISEKKHGKGIIRNYFNKIVILAFLSLSISLITYLSIRSQFIVFGILHFFTLGFSLILFFRKFRYLNFIIGIALIIIGNAIGSILVGSKFLFWLGFKYDGFYSADYYPVIPWFGVMIIGYSIGVFLIEKNLIDKVFSGEIKYLRIIGFLGRKSLLIYVIHAPIIFLILSLFFPIRY